MILRPPLLPTSPLPRPSPSPSPQASWLSHIGRVGHWPAPSARNHHLLLPKHHSVYSYGVGDIVVGGRVASQCCSIPLSRTLLVNGGARRFLARGVARPRTNRNNNRSRGGGGGNNSKSNRSSTKGLMDGPSIADLEREFNRSISRFRNRLQRGGGSGGGYADGASLAVWGLLGVNTAVFLGWLNAQSNSRATLFMFKNFTCSWHNLRESRPWTLLTSAFSQMHLSHFLVNAFVLHSFGMSVAQSLGPRRFVMLYLVAGLVSSSAHLLFVRATATQRRGVTVMNDIPSLGASGAIMAIAVLFAALNPQAQVLVFFVVPLNVRVAVGAFILWDFTNLDMSGRASSRPGGTTVDRAAHLAGAATGLLYYLTLLRRGGGGGFPRSSSDLVRRWRGGRRS